MRPQAVPIHAPKYNTRLPVPGRPGPPGPGCQTLTAPVIRVARQPWRRPVPGVRQPSDEFLFFPISSNSRKGWAVRQPLPRGAARASRPGARRSGSNLVPGSRATPRTGSPGPGPGPGSRAGPVPGPVPGVPGYQAVRETRHPGIQAPGPWTPGTGVEAAAGYILRAAILPGGRSGSYRPE